jgi:dihydrolipoamide dehydrogenase
MSMVIIGGGPGGAELAGILARRGRRVSLIERRAAGGTCTNRGCIPTKFLLEGARNLAAREGETPRDAFARLQARKKALTDGLSRKMAADLREAGVELIAGSARFAGGLAVAWDGEGGGGRIDAEGIVLATGSESIRLPQLPVDGERVLDSDQLLEIDHVPASLAIVGSGFIGCEFAFLFRMLGARVTVLELLPQILPAEDEDAAAVVRTSMERRGIDVRTGVSVEGASLDPSGDVALALTGGGSVAAERVLVSVGRRATTGGLDAGLAGVTLDARGAVVVDRFLESTARGVHAIGDVTGGMMLAHVATRQARFLGDVMTDRAAVPIDYDAIPWAVFTTPEVASVGVNRRTAAQRNLAVRTGTAHFTGNMKARIEGEQSGFVRIVAEAGSGRIVGGTIVGRKASEMIHILSMAVAGGLTTGELGNRVFAHPTLSEAIEEAARRLE